MLHGRGEPRIIVSGAQLTGVERLLGRTSGLTYHIGGCGIFPEEAVIRSVGETVERYAQVVTPLTPGFRTRFASAAEMSTASERTVLGPYARPFTDAQYRQDRFAYQPLADSRVTWARVTSLIDGESAWAPAQLLYIGYGLRRADGEPWLNSAVTTGSAAHTSKDLALRSALLELVQGDAAMGHWYSGTAAPRILLDRRTTALADLISRHVPAGRYSPDFHWLTLPGFPFLVVACVMRARPGSGRGAALGLGISADLEESMYKALLEAAAGVQLSKMLRISPDLVDGASTARTRDTSRMMDLDANVAHYAHEDSRAVIDDRFPLEETVAASDLPPDGPLDARANIEQIVEGYRRLGAPLLVDDCTTTDAAQLGFTVTRVWSPDTLSLCLPSAPPLAHPRFAAYGGPATDVQPHPYA
ncbi:YcaO-like family protein [Streptomyces sp. AC563]|uniref:YcaO-like family protein n=1 Tax=Streptomyces buecherae TaxID=2763006 RepID=UPI00164EA1E6|nr:YcaO-like family protein [Streptomyces buecherae]MBC3989706.1 YcaO-like family protein [Streptomyces buecherae]